jgi:hypothetical protein
MTDKLKGAVATVLSSRELVINLGSEAGVEPGMKFAVLNRKGVDITDPETNESIGSVPIAKVIVEVTRVEPKLSVARTFKKRRRNVGGSGALGIASMTNLFEPPKYVDEWETLRTAQKPEIAELPADQSYVKRGDPVEQVVGEEFDTSPALPE